MKLSKNGIEFSSDDYFYWFDLTEDRKNYFIGYEKYVINGKSHHWLCFWFFNVGWSF